MSSGDWKPGCPNCPCPSCRPATYPPLRQWPDATPAGVTVVGEQECTFDRIARDYAARGIPMPTSWLLVCNCRRCKPLMF